MLSYQHIYHAGNFADVQKHAILLTLLRALQLKTQPLWVMDTHAGRGLYDLSSEEAQKTGEFRHGIAHFWPQRQGTSPLTPYLQAVEKFNPQGDLLTAYPGSALLIRDMLRKGDSLICIERHPGEFRELQINTAGDPRVKATLQDGFQALVDIKPQHGRRGLVLIDPSYEIKTEYQTLPGQILRAWKKWPQAVFMLWYPILESRPDRLMLAALHQNGIKDILVSEIKLAAAPEEGFRMYGSGIAIINPPFPAQGLEQLTQHIALNMPQKAFGETYWLDNQKIDPDTGLLA